MTIFDFYNKLGRIVRGIKMPDFEFTDSIGSEIVWDDLEKNEGNMCLIITTNWTKREFEDICDVASEVELTELEISLFSGAIKVLQNKLLGDYFK